MKILKVMVLFLLMGPMVSSAWAEPDGLKVTVGPSLQMGDLGKVNRADLLVSPTGAIAAFVPTRRWPGREGKLWMAYRVSADGGKTWTGQFEAPMPVTASQLVGSGLTVNAPPRSTAFKLIGRWEHMTRPVNWFSARVAQFGDDLMQYKVEWLQASVAEAVVVVKEAGGQAHRTEKVMPFFERGQMVQLEGSEFLLAAHGKFKGDSKWRAFLIRSLDGGRIWKYFSTIGSEPEAPAPQLPGEFSGYRDPTIALLPNGEILAVLRAHDSDKPPYQPLYVSRSTDKGKSWTKPQPTDPPLYSISPTRVVLDNGVVACAYGRPGLHSAFSADNGRTWSRDKKLTKVSGAKVTGQIDMVKVGPNKLMAIAGVGPGGTRVFPVTVELRGNPG